MYVGWRELKWARGRFALIGAVIVLITVLVGFLSGLTKGLGAQSTSAISGLHASGLVFGAPTFDASRVPDDLVQDATPIGIATLRATGKDGSGAVAVIGVPPGSTVAPDAAGVRPGHAVLSREAANLLGGDISVAGRPLTEAGAPRGDASYGHRPVVWLSLSDWQGLTGSHGHATILAFDGAAPSVPSGYDVRTPAQSLVAIGGYTSEHQTLLLIRGFLLVISALVIGAFFTVWTIQRAGDIAVLKALGATSASLLRDALGQAAIVLGLGAGVGAGIVLIAGRVVGSAVPFSLDVVTLGLPVGLLVVLGLAGAGLAVRRVVSVDPLTALAGK